MTASRAPEYVGIGNFLTMLTNEIFWISLRNTLVFTIVTVITQFVLGFGTALLLNRNWHSRRVRSMIRSALIIPMMFTYVVVGLLWAMMMHSELGIINYLLSLVGLRPVGWLSNANVAMISVIIVDLWFRTPFVTLLMLSGLQSVPVEPKESAVIDGANKLQVFWYVVVPLLRPVILVVLVLRTMWNFISFDTVFILTRGGPGYSTELLTLFGYKTAFSYYRMGEASAISFSILALVLVFTYFYIKLIGQED
jgi:multiple sugar transport system permease protein